MFWIDFYKKTALLTILFLASCTENSSEPPLEYVLSSKNKALQKVMGQVEKHELQILYTEILRNGDSVDFEEHSFQVNDSFYFYPASTVKLPAAIFALQKLDSTSKISLDTRFYIEGDTLETTMANEIKKIFAISDNTAFNRLVEFLGQNEINQGMHQAGIETSRFSHRLSVDDAYNITTKPLVIYLNDSTSQMLKNTINTYPKPLKIKGTIKGTGYFEEEELINEPFDMSLKNWYSIRAQHETLKRIFFPEKFKTEHQFKISEAHTEFLKEMMAGTPRALGYDADKYPDGYNKFFMFGSSTDTIPQHIKIYNKVGYAYGTLTDNAYFVDRKNGVEFFLTATILSNENGIFNDNQYEFESTALPFLEALGKEIYQYQLNRK
jgi:hypothetical protein